jgi:hypothetical protein
MTRQLERQQALIAQLVEQAHASREPAPTAAGITGI